GRRRLGPPEAEAIGLPRMLDCASDVGPEGAMARLAAHGAAEPAAYELVIELASLERDVARARLLARGLDPAAADDVLAATHCEPPPAYVVLTSAMIQAPSWRYLGSFDPRRALAVSTLRADGADAAGTALGRAADRRRGDGVRGAHVPARRPGVEPPPPSRAGQPASRRARRTPHRGCGRDRRGQLPAVARRSARGARRRLGTARARRAALPAALDVPAAHAARRSLRDPAREDQ